MDKASFDLSSSIENTEASNWFGKAWATAIMLLVLIALLMCVFKLGLVLFG